MIHSSDSRQWDLLHEIVVEQPHVNGPSAFLRFKITSMLSNEPSINFAAERILDSSP